MVHHLPFGNAGCATCNRLFQIGSETRTIEIDDSIGRGYGSDTERDRESYTEVCDVCLSRPIILDVQVCGRLMDDRRHADPSPGALGPGKGTYGSSSLYVGDQNRRIFLRSAKPVAARVEREHQWPAEIYEYDWRGRSKLTTIGRHPSCAHRKSRVFWAPHTRRLCWRNTKKFKTDHSPERGMERCQQP